MSPCRKILVRLCAKWKKLPEYPAIFCLDERILQKIYQHLSLVDQVCLSLSCKELFCLFGTIVKHKDLEFPRLLRIRNPILCVNSRDVPRNQLLLRLENRRWAYCAQCLKLHPRKEFPRHSLRRSAMERACTYYAGIAYLCPCISLTIRGRDQLVKILKSPPKPKTQYGPFKYDVGNAGHPILGHVCEFSTRTGYVVRVALVLAIKEPGQLCVVARHSISFYSSDAHLTAEPTFACPHRDLLSFDPSDQDAKDELHMYQTLMSSKPYRDILPFVPGELVSKACPMCPTVISKYPVPEDIKHADFWVVRNLGSCESPADRSWFDQCRLTGALFSLNEAYWYRLQNLWKMTQGVHSQWIRDYYLERERRLLRHQRQRKASRTADEGGQIACTICCFLQRRFVQGKRGRLTE